MWPAVDNINAIATDIKLIFSLNNFIDHAYWTIYSLPVYEVTTYKFLLSKLFTMMRVTLVIWAEFWQPLKKEWIV